MLQTAWLELFTAIDRIREPAAVGGWLATVTRRNALRSRQAGMREQLSADPEPVDRLDLQGPEESVLTAERETVLAAAAAALPERHRRVVTVLLSEPTPDYRQVGEQLAMPVGSIGPSRARALARLARHPQLRAVGSVAAAA